METNLPLPKLKRPSIINEQEPEVEIKPDTYFYLTKTQ
jgi:hypothetical protein